jgi:hypothetical protein
LKDANVKVKCAVGSIWRLWPAHTECLVGRTAPPQEIAQFAKGRAKKKIPELVAALEGHRMSEHHRQLIRYSVEHLAFLEDQVAKIDTEIRRKILEAGFSRKLSNYSRSSPE